MIPIKAKVWIGQEKENSGEGIRIFADKRATVSDIFFELSKHPEVNCIYFGHGVTEEVLNYFFNKIRIIVEIDDTKDVPLKYLGKIDLILRIPNYISGIKYFRGDKLTVNMFNGSGETNWDCRKIYKEDTVLEEL